MKKYALNLSLLLLLVCFTYGLQAQIFNYDYFLSNEIAWVNWKEQKRELNNSYTPNFVTNDGVGSPRH